MRNISLLFRSVVKSLILVSVLSMAAVSAHAQDAKEGKTLFQQKCTSCHAIDKVVVGPALKDVSKRHEEEWLIKWIRNSQAMVAAGDEQAVALFEGHNNLVMTAFPDLSDDQIKNILTFIDESSQAPAGGGTEQGAPGAAAADSGNVSNFMLFGLLAVIVIAFVVIIVLNRVIKTLERIILNKNIVIEEEDEEEGEGKNYFETIKKLAKNKKLVFFFVLGLVAFLGSAGWKTLWNVGVHEGYKPVQPIKFSHQLHAGVNQIECQYCHSGAFKSKNASIPSANVCMNCHKYVTASEKYNGETSPEIQKIYNALDWDGQKYGPNQRPIQWVRIHNLPDFAYFNHSQHVVVAGVECQKCHGPIETMDEVYQYSPLTMKWCVNCHRETEVNHKDNAYYDQLIAAHEKLKEGDKITAASLGGLECGKCHY
ncbi:cytochrome c3 family protein [Olivibacter domesticus]|uniref:Cytochrome c553 n=1 Tax=Olivibacter domesticus TaxID=407022 RepID=A0A1H7VNC4_OLID1|nr:cytochrome c3 family protein [Olivibacter domesticus]SEM10741.1 Cytochrome c553 [Olivibacter domesticus]